MNAKHTPGPWIVERSDVPQQINGHAHHCWEIASPGEDMGIAIVILPDEDRSAEAVEERAATASLITAAPETYEALDGLLAAIPWKDIPDKLLESSRAAIAKARAKAT